MDPMNENDVPIKKSEDLRDSSSLFDWIKEKEAPEIIKIERSPEYGKSLTVTMAITDRCPYACSYCPPNLHDGREDTMSFEQLQRLFSQIRNHYSDRHIHLVLTGGEPSYLSYFVDMVKFVRDLDIEIGLTTNGIRPRAFWKKYSHFFNYISFSFHTESMKTKEDIEDFVAKVELASLAAPVMIRVMMNPKPEQWSKAIDCIEIANKNLKYGGLEVVKLVPDFGTGENYSEIHYTKEQLDFIQNFTGFLRYNPDVIRERPGHSVNVHLSNGQSFKAPHLQEVINYQLNDFRGWVCHAGLDSLYIDTRGFIFMANCGVGGKIGRVRDEKHNFPQMPIVCPKKSCHCGSDLFITKYALDHQRSRFSYKVLDEDVGR